MRKLLIAVLMTLGLMAASIPAQAAGTEYLYMGDNRGWASSKQISVMDLTCNGVPTLVIYYKINVQGERQGPWRLSDDNGCAEGYNTRSYSGTEWSIDAFKLCVAPDTGTRCTGWANVTDVA